MDVVEGARVDVDILMGGEFRGEFFELGFGAAVDFHFIVGGSKELSEDLLACGTSGPDDCVGGHDESWVV